MNLIHAVNHTLRMFANILLPTMPQRIECPPVPIPSKRRTFARLRLCRMRLRKSGHYVCAGYTPPAKGESVQQLWVKYGWFPPHNGLQMVAGKVEITEVSENVKPMKRGAK